MYCSNCGQKLDDNATFCQQCGQKVDAAMCNTSNNVVDKPNPGFSVLSFFIPIFGIAIYFAEHKNKPIACKRYLIWSFVSIGLIVLFYVLYFAFIICMVMFSSELS